MDRVLGTGCVPAPSLEWPGAATLADSGPGAEVVLARGQAARPRAKGQARLVAFEAGCAGAVAAVRRRGVRITRPVGLAATGRGIATGTG